MSIFRRRWCGWTNRDKVRPIDNIAMWRQPGRRQRVPDVLTGPSMSSCGSRPTMRSLGRGDLNLSVSGHRLGREARRAAVRAASASSARSALSDTVATRLRGDGHRRREHRRSGQLLLHDHEQHRYRSRLPHAAEQHRRYAFQRRQRQHRAGERAPNTTRSKPSARRTRTTSTWIAQDVPSGHLAEVESGGGNCADRIPRRRIENSAPGCAGAISSTSRRPARRSAWATMTKSPSRCRSRSISTVRPRIRSASTTTGSCCSARRCVPGSCCTPTPRCRQRRCRRQPSCRYGMISTAKPATLHDSARLDAEPPVHRRMVRSRPLRRQQQLGWRDIRADLRRRRHDRFRIRRRRVHGIQQQHVRSGRLQQRHLRDDRTAEGHCAVQPVLGLRSGRDGRFRHQMDRDDAADLHEHGHRDRQRRRAADRRQSGYSVGHRITRRQRHDSVCGRESRQPRSELGARRGAARDPSLPATGLALRDAAWRSGEGVGRRGSDRAASSKRAQDAAGVRSIFHSLRRRCRLAADLYLGQFETFDALARRRQTPRASSTVRKPLPAALSSMVISRRSTR